MLVRCVRRPRHRPDARGLTLPARYAKACKLYVASLGTWTARVPATTPVRAWKEAVLCFAASEDGRRILASMRGALELRLATQDERASFAEKHRDELQPETLRAWGVSP